MVGLHPQAHRVPAEIGRCTSHGRAQLTRERRLLDAAEAGPLRRGFDAGVRLTGRRVHRHLFAATARLVGRRHGAGRLGTPRRLGHPGPVHRTGGGCRPRTAPTHLDPSPAPPAALAPGCGPAGGAGAAAAGTGVGRGTGGGATDSNWTGRGMATGCPCGGAGCRGACATRAGSGATGRNAWASRPAPTTTAAAHAVTKARAAWRVRVGRRGAAASVPCCLSIAAMVELQAPHPCRTAERPLVRKEATAGPAQGCWKLAGVTTISKPRGSRSKKRPASREDSPGR